MRHIRLAVVGLSLFALIHCASNPPGGSPFPTLSQPSSLPPAPRASVDPAYCASPQPIPQPPVLPRKGSTTSVQLTEKVSQWSFCVDSNGQLPGPTPQPFNALLYDDGSGPSLLPRVWRVNPGDTVNVHVVNGLTDSSGNPATTTMLRLPARRAAAAGAPVAATSTPLPFTNLHFHGFNVSPEPIAPNTFGDNVYVTIQAGPANNSADYSVNLPANHAEGMYWFHPHPHGYTELQVLGGLSGIIIVGNILDDLYGNFGTNNNVQERYFMLKDVDPREANSTTPGVPVNPFPSSAGPLNPALPLLKTINGVTSGTISINQNEVQLWDFANAGADAFFDLQILGTDGKTVVPFNVISVDGNPTPTVRKVNDLFLPPGSRMQVLVQFPTATTPTATYKLQHSAVNTGFPNSSGPDPNPTVLLATINVSQSQVAPVTLPSAPTVPDPRPSLAQLKSMATVKRTIDFEEDNPGPNFYICGQTFSATPVQTQVTIPKGQTSVVEQWTITNSTNELHVFHIHQTDFMVDSITPNFCADPTQQPPACVSSAASTGYQDTVTIPAAATNGTPGSATVYINFAISGLFVYHCHILGHEDGGMMASICVEPEGTACPALPPPPPGHQMGVKTISAPANCGQPASAAQMSAHQH